MYILDANGQLVILPANAPLPAGAHIATAEEVAKWQAEDTARSGAGIPAPKTATQAAAEHAALAENIAKHGGLATPVEQKNLADTAPGATPTEAAPGLVSPGTLSGGAVPAGAVGSVTTETVDYSPAEPSKKPTPAAWQPETTAEKPPKGKGA